MYPLLQSHLNDPLVLLQMWWHFGSFDNSLHSSMSTQSRSLWEESLKPDLQSHLRIQKYLWDVQCFERHKGLIYNAFREQKKKLIASVF